METLLSSGSQSLLSGVASLPFGGDPVGIAKTAVTIASNLPVTIQPLPAQQPKDALQSGIAMIFQTMMTVLNQLLTSLFQEVMGPVKKNASAEQPVDAAAASHVSNPEPAVPETPDSAEAHSPSTASQVTQPSQGASQTASPAASPVISQAAQTTEQQATGFQELISSFSALTGNISGLLGTVTEILKGTVESKFREYKTALASAKKSIKSLKSQISKLSADLAKKNTKKLKL